MLPVHAFKTFPALTDPDAEEPRNHVFEVQDESHTNQVHRITAILDSTITIHMEYDQDTKKLQLVQTPVGWDVVHPALYNRLRPFFEYAGGDLHPAEAFVIGEDGPEGTDACFLPTFGPGGPLIPYIFKNVIRNLDEIMLVVPQLPT
jgi:hypothetical protein